MLAAHRNGGRTSLASFAHAWDRYTARQAAQAAPGDRARADHAAGDARGERRARRAAAPGGRAAPQAPAARADTGERYRVAELGPREGWAWLRLFRRLDEYERALAELERAERERVEAGELVSA